MIHKHTGIVILGAGVAGLTSAIALHQKGFSKITIYERRETATTLGAGLVLWANASKILHKLNLLSEVAKLAGEIYEMQRWTQKGTHLGTIDVQDINKGIGSKSYAISRFDFQQILLKKIAELHIPIRYSHSVLDLVTQETSVTVIFENQASVNASILIGADGRMNSIARKYVNRENTPVYQNFVNWIGIIESEQPIFTEHHVLDFWGCGERFGIVPITKYKGYWAGGKSLPRNSPLKQKNNKTELLKIFSSWSPKIKQVIEGTKEQDIRYLEVFDHHPISNWFRNNVCLIGDSAHAALPTSGQGACQAIEDAWHLAAQLSSAHTLEKAFSQFQKIRFPKTTAITMAGRELGHSLFNPDPEWCQQRNENAMHADNRITSQNIAQLWSKDLPQ